MPHRQASATWGFHVGTFSAQLANNAFVVTLPLIVLQNYGSAGLLGILLATSTAVDAVGTITGGYLLRYAPARSWLLLTTILRSVLVALIPILFSMNLLSLPLLATVVIVDALARGIADTCRYTVPLQHTDGAAVSLSRFNSSYQFAFEAGGIIGPVLVGFLLAATSTFVAHWLVVLGLIGAWLGYLLLPALSNATEQQPTTSRQETLHLNRRWEGLILLAQACLTLNPLKTILPAVFATQILLQPEYTAWIVAAFGVGGLSGALFARQLKIAWSLRQSLTYAAAGTLVLALAWLPASLWIMLICVIVFATLNVIARLQLLTHVQLHTPASYATGVIARLRLTANLSSMGVKFLAGMCLAIPNITTAFTVLSTGLVGAGVLQWIAGRFSEQQQRVTNMTEAIAPESVASGAHG